VNGTYPNNSSYNEFILNSAGKSNINKNGFTKILMTFENWDSRVSDCSEPGIGTSSNYRITCWHPDDTPPPGQNDTTPAAAKNHGAELHTTFKQATNPGAFWLMG
jgi:hypothetical protein